jgi:geranylgeranyl diphosphate synthase type I
MRISMVSGYRCRVVTEVKSTIEQVRSEIRSELADYLSGQRAYLTSIASELVPVCDALDEFLLDGGKRLRPLFAYAGLIASGATPTREIIRAISSLELLQACALIHDDLMDRSDTRRGKPAIHRHFENLHQSSAMNGLATQFGEAAAVLLGDLALVWSDQMLNTSGISTQSLLAAHIIHDEMRVELMAGQYLDVREAGEKTYSAERSLRIARYKSGKYTIERPLHIGAVIGTPEKSDHSALLDALSRYGLPLGEAFQLRDDMLGIFGDPEVTGKPAGDDLREGKRTVLIAMTLEALDETGRAELFNHLGQPDISLSKIEELRSLITSSGAVEKIENLIEKLTNDSLSAIEDPSIHPSSREFLTYIALSAVKRSA